MTECDTDSPIEHVLSDEDAVCCSFLLFVGLAFFSLSLVFFLFCLSFSIYFKGKSMFVPKQWPCYKPQHSCFVNTFPDRRIRYVFIPPSISSVLALLFNLIFRQSGSRKWEIILMRLIVCVRKTDYTLCCAANLKNFGLQTVGMLHLSFCL